jgi:hypothetical protein
MGFINLLRTSVRYVDTCATAEGAECPINRQSHNRYIQQPYFSCKSQETKANDVIAFSKEYVISPRAVITFLSPRIFFFYDFYLSLLFQRDIAYVSRL